MLSRSVFTLAARSLFRPKPIHGELKCAWEPRGSRNNVRSIHQTSTEAYAEELEQDDENAPRRLLDAFKLEHIDRDIYRALRLVRGLKMRDAVYGGQVIGQALRAASDTVEKGKKPHSMHCYFIRAGTVMKPILYLVDRVRDGKSFCTRIVKGIQDGETLFITSISFHRAELGGMEHEQPMPSVAAPSELLSYRQLIEKALWEDDDKPESERMTEHQRFMLEFKLMSTPPTFHRVFEHRPVNQQLFSFQNNLSPKYQMWIKSVIPCGEDYDLQRQMAAYTTDSSMIETAIFPHVAKGFIPSMAPLERTV